MKHTACLQELLIESEEKSNGNKAGKEVKAEKKDGKECFTHPGFLYEHPLTLGKHYNASAVRLIPFPVFETQTPPPNAAC